jgi:hypothetical protein
MLIVVAGYHPFVRSFGGGIHRLGVLLPESSDDPRRPVQDEEISSEDLSAGKATGKALAAP